MRRVILEYTDDDGDLALQASVATIAIREGIKPGETWGMMRAGRTYGIKCTSATVRIYPQESGA